MQIQTGLFDLVVVESHSKISELVTLEDVIRLSQDPIFEAPLGGHPLSVAGLEMREYLNISSTTEEQCARVVVQNKKNALRNPMASFAGDLTTDDVLASSPYFDPIKELDIAPTVDGAVVLVLTRKDRAETTQHPIYVSGIGWSSDAPWIGERGAEATYAKDAAARAYRMANIKKPQEELDLLEVDDQFSYKELQHLDAIGVSNGKPVGKMLEEGVFAPDGALPTNTSGGSLGIGNAFEANGLLKVAGAVQQLRGHAGSLQIAGARRALVQSWRGVPHGTGAVAILERRDG